MKKSLLIISLWICPVFATSDLATALLRLEDGSESLTNVIEALKVSFSQHSPDGPIETLEYIVASIYKALADVTQYQVDEEKLARIAELQEQITIATKDTTYMISALKLELSDAENALEEHNIEMFNNKLIKDILDPKINALRSTKLTLHKNKSIITALQRSIGTFVLPDAAKQKQLEDELKTKQTNVKDITKRLRDLQNETINAKIGGVERKIAETNATKAKGNDDQSEQELKRLESDLEVLLTLQTNTQELNRLLKEKEYNKRYFIDTHIRPLTASNRLNKFNNFLRDLFTQVYFHLEEVKNDKGEHVAYQEGSRFIGIKHYITASLLIKFFLSHENEIPNEDIRIFFSETFEIFKIVSDSLDEHIRSYLTKTFDITEEHRDRILQQSKYIGYEGEAEKLYNDLRSIYIAFKTP
jgi:hypothetical protein